MAHGRPARCAANACRRRSWRSSSQYHWPGNVRELENVVERLVVTAKSDVRDGSATCRWKSARRCTAARHARAPHDDRRRPVSRAWSTKANRSGRRSIRSTCSGKSPGNVRDSCAGLEDARGTTRSSRACSIWARRLQALPEFPPEARLSTPFKEYGNSDRGAVCDFTDRSSTVRYSCCSSVSGRRGGPSPGGPGADRSGRDRGRQPGVPVAVSTGDRYVIGPDDVLSIVFWRDKDMSADVVVRPDGKILAAAAERYPGRRPDA